MHHTITRVVIRLPIQFGLEIFWSDGLVSWPYNKVGQIQIPTHIKRVVLTQLIWPLGWVGLIHIPNSNWAPFDIWFNKFVSLALHICWLLIYKGAFWKFHPIFKSQIVLDNLIIDLLSLHTKIKISNCLLIWFFPSHCVQWLKPLWILCSLG